MKDKRLITFVYEDKRYKMKDKRLITFVYTFSESALYSLLSFSVAVFYPLGLITFVCEFSESKLFNVSSI